MKTYRQDSDDTEAYVIDWADELKLGRIATDVNNPLISSSVWTVESGITSSDEAVHNGRMTRIVLSGGTVGTSYKAENKITTTQGLVYTKSFYVQVVNK